jgi:cytochrome bd ubiquinol oxidase subunit I
MDDLTAAREQMALSLGFHIVFAVLGVGMPLLMVFAEWRGLRRDDPLWTALARRWSKAVAVLFAVGAVSGTVLSIEFGLLWPTFMERFGAALALPFTLESFAFFVEAIFLGLYLYGWDRLSPRVHLLTGIPVLLGGVASAAFVTTANAVAMLRDPAKNDGYHRRGLAAGAVLGLMVAPLQVVVGDWATRAVAESQPAKFAAMEGLAHTADGAPFTIGGSYDEHTGDMVGAVEIPRLLSLLLEFDPSARITGLDAVPAADRPPVTITHLAFDVMVGIGTLLVLLAAWAAWLAWRRRFFRDRALRWALAVAGPLPFVALIAGWIVTEVGRQPWIVYQVMRVPEALTTRTGLATFFYVTAAVYLVLSVALVAILRRIAAAPRPLPVATGDRA